MTEVLSKGGNVALPEDSLRAVVVGLGWSPATPGTPAHDLDASALLLDATGRVPDDNHFVFYNNLTSPDGSVRHAGDAAVGVAHGDVETIHVDLSQVPGPVQRIVFCVSIHAAQARGQQFDQVQDAYIRVLNAQDGRQLARFELGEDGGTETAMIFGELYRYHGIWKFRAVGQGYAEGLRGIATDFGVAVDEE